eukprot:gene18608-15202_t
MLSFAVVVGTILYSDVPRPKSLLGHHPGRPTEEEALSLPSRNGQDYLLLDQKKSTVRIVAEFVQPITQPVNVTVTWFGVSSPEESDWIAVYCPFDSKPEAYFDYLELGTGNPDGKPYPYGAYFPFDLSAPAPAPAPQTHAVLAISEKVAFPAAMPLGVHVSLLKDPTSVTVIWNSDSPSAPTVVWYAVDGSGTPQSASGTTTTYTVDDLCGSEAAIVAPNGFIDPGFFHRVRLTG